MSPYRCGTCDSPTIKVAAASSRWSVTCGNGHEVTPTSGTTYLVLSYSHVAGSVRVGEDHYPIDSIELRDSAFQIRFHLMWTERSSFADHIALFGADGSLLVRDVRVDSLPAVARLVRVLQPGDTIEAVWSLSIPTKLTIKAAADRA